MFPSNIAKFRISPPVLNSPFWCFSFAFQGAKLFSRCVPEIRGHCETKRLHTHHYSENYLHFFATLLFSCIRLFWERNNVQTKLIFDQVQELMMQWLCKHVSWILVVGTPLWSANFALNKTFKLTWTQSTAGRIEKELENTNARKTIKTTTTPTATTTTHHIKHTQKKMLQTKLKYWKHLKPWFWSLAKKVTKNCCNRKLCFQVQNTGLFKLVVFCSNSLLLVKKYN